MGKYQHVFWVPNGGLWVNEREAPFFGAEAPMVMMGEALPFSPLFSSPSSLFPFSLSQGFQLSQMDKWLFFFFPSHKSPEQVLAFFWQSECIMSAHLSSSRSVIVCQTQVFGRTSKIPIRWAMSFLKGGVGNLHQLFESFSSDFLRRRRRREKEGERSRQLLPLPATAQGSRASWSNLQILKKKSELARKKSTIFNQENGPPLASSYFPTCVCVCEGLYTESVNG